MTTSQEDASETREASDAQSDPEALVEAFCVDVARVEDEIHKRIVGQDDTLRGVLTCLLAGGHALLEGVPGLGKTLMVRTLADVLDLRFNRIQFTPDLMPADIVGTNVLTEAVDGAHRVEFREGPVFANVVLADEVNRATPKTQSALLEVMQEHSVTVSGRTRKMDEPYLVLATQNPLEMEGTYPLPEAQLDRFLLKLQVGFPTREELHGILERTTGAMTDDIHAVLGAPRILEMRGVVREVAVARHVRDYAIRLLTATHPDHPSAPDEVRRFVRFGASPRGAQACLLAARVRCLLAQRFAVATEDLREVMKAALRHRLILNFEGEAEGVAPDDLLAAVIEAVPERAD